MSHDLRLNFELMFKQLKPKTKFTTIKYLKCSFGFDQYYRKIYNRFHFIGQFFNVLCVTYSYALFPQNIEYIIHVEIIHAIFCIHCWFDISN